MKKIITERVIRNWITTLIGFVIAVVATIMWYQLKIDTAVYMSLAPVVFAFIFVKHSFFKKTTNV